ncbi:MAG TPA: hypothetical protein VFI39_00485 [Gemmatimonadales bacterium]|nr:hypothetical protein [Gemmatimonadales bacterium]
MTIPGENDTTDLTVLLRSEAPLPLGMRARVEAKVTQALREDGHLTWGERIAIGTVALVIVGGIPGGFLAGPLILAAWSVAALYGALLNVEEDPIQ